MQWVLTAESTARNLKVWTDYAKEYGQGILSLFDHNATKIEYVILYILGLLQEKKLTTLKNVISML